MEVEGKGEIWRPQPPGAIVTGRASPLWASGTGRVYSVCIEAELTPQLDCLVSFSFRCFCH